MKPITILTGILITLYTLFTGIPDLSIDNSEQDNIVATINGEPVYLSELNQQFNRNPITDPESSIREQLQDFLPSYVFYRLKLLDGLEAGFDQDPELLDEFNTFAREAAYSYWLDHTIKAHIIDTFKNRMTEERKAFHILAEVSQNESAENIEAAFNRMHEARDELIAGADPDDVNQRFSTSRNLVPIGGHLPWVTAGRTVTEFEDALFALNEGEISLPVRSQFGYHVIGLQEIRERSWERLVSHIFFYPAEDDSVRLLAEEAYSKLNEGHEWDAVADTFSMDPASASRGGYVGWVGYGMQFPEPFVDAVMAAEIGKPFSELIEMDYGYHIIRVDSVMTFEDETHLNEYVMNELQRLQRLSPGRNQVYTHLMELGDLQINTNVKDEILSVSNNGFNSLEEFSHETLLTYFGEELTVNELIKYLETANDRIEILNDEHINDFITEIVRESLIRITSEYHPEYRANMADFLNGLIVFKVNEEFIWNPEMMDKAELRQFYENNLHHYRLERNYSYFRFSSVSDSIITEAYHTLLSGENPGEIEEHFPEIHVITSTTRNPGSEVYSILETMNPGDLSDIEDSGGSMKTFYYLTEIVEPRTMTFDEAFYRVANDFQPLREEAYLNELMTKYNVKLFPENI